jgi:hypothetical protein
MLSCCNVLCGVLVMAVIRLVVCCRDVHVQHVRVLLEGNKKIDEREAEGKRREE